MKKGFTLIELLVVVLIIGILSAVALPKYHRAVEKARATEAVQAGKAWGKAQSIYKMETGEYTDDLEALSIEIPELKYFSMSSYGYGSSAYAYFYPTFYSVGCGIAHIQFWFQEGKMMGCCWGNNCGGVLNCGNSLCEM